jgi:hypothetical protein
MELETFVGVLNICIISEATAGPAAGPAARLAVTKQAAFMQP